MEKTNILEKKHIRMPIDDNIIQRFKLCMASVKKQKYILRSVNNNDSNDKK